MTLPPLPPLSPLNQDVSLAQNGFCKIPNGLWLQWGRTTLLGGGGSTTITFPKAFPKQCYNVQATVIASPNTSLVYTVQVETVTKTNCLISGNRTDGSAVTAPQMDFYWQAIGH